GGPRGGFVLKVAGRSTGLPAGVRAADAARATAAARATLGLSWLSFAPGDELAERVAAARRALAHRHTTVLDGARSIADPWPPPAPGALARMERLKARFDPARILRPGACVGGVVHVGARRAGPP